MLNLSDPIAIPMELRLVDFSKPCPGIGKGAATLDVTWGDLLLCAVMVGHKSVAAMQRHAWFSQADALRRMHVVIASLDHRPHSGGRHLLRHSPVYRDTDQSEHVYFSYTLGMASSLIVAQERFDRPLLQHFDAATGATSGKRPDLISPKQFGRCLVVEAKGTRGSTPHANRQMKAGYAQVGAVVPAAGDGLVVVSSFSRQVDHVTKTVGEWEIHAFHDRHPSAIQAGARERSETSAWLLRSAQESSPQPLFLALGDVALLIGRQLLTRDVLVTDIEGSRYVGAVDLTSGYALGMQEDVLWRTLGAARELNLDWHSALAADIRGAFQDRTLETNVEVPDERQVVRGPLALWQP